MTILIILQNIYIKTQYKNYIRLVNASGLWKLDKIDSSNTKVTYLWNGELLGDFPSWALSKASISQGKINIFNTLNKIIESKL